MNVLCKLKFDILIAKQSLLGVKHYPIIICTFFIFKSSGEKVFCPWTSDNNQVYHKSNKVTSAIYLRNRGKKSYYKVKAVDLKKCCVKSMVLLNIAL